MRVVVGVVPDMCVCIYKEIVIFTVTSDLRFDVLIGHTLEGIE